MHACSDSTTISSSQILSLIFCCSRRALVLRASVGAHRRRATGQAFSQLYARIRMVMAGNPTTASGSFLYAFTPLRTAPVLSDDHELAQIKLVDQ
jgi:hypothetical protein